MRPFLPLLVACLVVANEASVPAADGKQEVGVGEECEGHCKEVGSSTLGSSLLAKTVTTAASLLEDSDRLTLLHKFAEHWQMVVAFGAIPMGAGVDCAYAPVEVLDWWGDTVWCTESATASGVPSLIDQMLLVRWVERACSAHADIEAIVCCTFKTASMQVLWDDHSADLIEQPQHLPRFSYVNWTALEKWEEKHKQEVEDLGGLCERLFSSDGECATSATECQSQTESQLSSEVQRLSWRTGFLNQSFLEVQTQLGKYIVQAGRYDTRADPVGSDRDIGGAVHAEAIQGAMLKKQVTLGKVLDAFREGPTLPGSDKHGSHEHVREVFSAMVSSSTLDPVILELPGVSTYVSNYMMGFALLTASAAFAANPQKTCGED